MSRISRNETELPLLFKLFQFQGFFHQFIHEIRITVVQGAAAAVLFKADLNEIFDGVSVAADGAVSQSVEIPSLLNKVRTEVEQDIPVNTGIGNDAAPSDFRGFHFKQRFDQGDNCSFSTQDLSADRECLF